MKPSSEEVAQYLLTHPQFFEEYADMLADIQVPHPHGGGAIPISERQIAALRDKNHTLHDKMGELIRFGEENGAINEKMHRLAIALLASTRLNNLLQALNVNLREDFCIPHMALRLWNITGEGPELPEFTRTSADVYTIAESLLHPYCGSHILHEINSWFGEDATRLRSFAMIPLRTEQTIGLLVMGSEDPQRFYPEMGTIYLTRLGELVSAALERYTPSELEKADNLNPAVDPLI